MAAPEERLVSAGAFRVDRARALEKLMRFALPEPSHAPLLLVRCAVASGATGIRVERGERGALTARFDGEPFSPEELAAPYEPLFRRMSPQTRRGRELATALLTLLRLEPRAVTVLSGRGDARRLLTAARGEAETVSPAPEEPGGTVVRFLPGPGTPRDPWGNAFAQVLRRSCAMAPIPVFLGEERLSSEPPAEWGGTGIPVAGPGLRGWVAPAAAPEPNARLQLFRLGVLVAEASVPAAVPVVGRVNDDGFRMNASQTGVIRDARYKAALEAVEKAAARLLADEAARQQERQGQLSRLLSDGELRRVWAEGLAEWLAPPAGDLLSALKRAFADPPRVDRELGRELRADARRCAWLREAAARAARGRLQGPAAAAALEAPVFPAPNLRFMGLGELARAVGELGYVPVTGSADLGAPGAFPVALVLSGPERDSLRRFFPGVPVSDAAEALERARRLDALPEGPAALERMGVARVLVRRPLAEPWSGEVGLPLHRPETPRLHVFVPGGGGQSFELPKDLRLAAALSHPARLTPSEAQRAAASVAAALPELYAAAAAEFSPEDAAPESQALRAHLLEALAWFLRGKSGAPAWLRALPLFPCEAGLLDHQALRARLGAGDTLFFQRRRSRLAAPSLTFRHELFDAAFLQRLLPDAETAALPGRPDLRAAWLPARPPAGEGVEAVLARLEDLLRRRGTLYDAPGDPERAFVREAVRRLFAPWMGAAAGAPRWHRVREHLGALPLVRRARGTGGWSAPQLDARLASGRPFTYSEAPGAEALEAADAVLAPEELGLLDALWPSAQRAVVPAGQESRRRPARAARAADRAPAPPAGAGEAYARELELDGLRAHGSLPPEPIPGVVASVEGHREPLEFALETPGLAGAGRLRLDVSGWRGPVLRGGKIHESLAKAAHALYHRFLYGLLDDWPELARGPRADALRAYLLLFAAPRPGGAGQWAAFRERLGALPLFPTLGGGTVSLSELAARGRAQGRLRYAKGPGAPASPADAGVPVIRLARMAAAALDVPLVAIGEAAAPPPATGDPLRDSLDALLAAVRGRRGLDPAILPEAGALRVVSSGGSRLLARHGKEWELDRDHPAARLVLDALAAGGAPFLVSILASAANRESARATDAHDALVQSLLAEALDGDGLVP